MRTLLIAGNWKMNPTTTEAAVALAEGVKTGLGTATDVHVAVCPPFVFLEPDRPGPGRTRRSASPRRTCTGRPPGRSPARSPAPCSSTSAAPTSSSATASGGTAWARPSAQVNKKLKAALEAKLIPIVCIGELKEERLAEQTEAVLLDQLTGSLAGLTPSRWPAWCWPTSRSGRSAPA